jgi:hypothetical protein
MGVLCTVGGTFVTFNLPAVSESWTFLQMNSINVIQFNTMVYVQFSYIESHINAVRERDRNRKRFYGEMGEGCS